MGYGYTPAYYSSIHDSITSLCKNILPFSFKKRRIPAIAAAEQRLSKQQSDNLKWQQDSFHQILKLMGLSQEGIVAEAEVSAFRSHLVDTLIASPLDHEHSAILRDKLVFLQELLYAKCISEDEYHSSKRPLLQRLAVQGAEIEARDVIVVAQKERSDEEWSVVDLKDEKCLLSKANSNLKIKLRQGSAMKQIKGAASSVLGFGSSNKRGKYSQEEEEEEEKCFAPTANPSSENVKPQRSPNDRNVTTTTSGDVPVTVRRHEKLGLSTENPFWNSYLMENESETKSILMSESLPPEPMKAEKKQSGGGGGGEKGKRKPFKTLFQKELQKEKEGLVNCSNENGYNSGKNQWGFDGFKKWKKADSDDETAPLASYNEKSGAGNLPEWLVPKYPLGGI